MSISSLVMPKRPDSAVMEQLKSSALSFVPAKQPEAVSNRPATYIHIKPRANDKEEKSDSENDDDEDDEEEEDDRTTLEKSKTNKTTQNQDDDEEEKEGSDDSEYEDALVLDKPIKSKKIKQPKTQILGDKERKRMAVADSFFNEISVSKTFEDDDDDDSENDGDYEAKESQEEDSDNNDDDESDDDEEDTDDNDGDNDDDDSEETSKITKEEIEFLKKDAELNNKEAEALEPAKPKTEKTLQGSREETHNTDAAYLTQREKIEKKTAQEAKRIENINKKFEFVKFGAPSKAHGSENSLVKKTYPKGITNPRGLINTGVTCYMNSALQALFHVPAIANYLKEVATDTYRGKLPPKSVTRDVAVLHQRLTDPAARKKTFTPRQLIKRLDDINPLMSEWEQEDSHEYFMSLLGRLQEDSVPKGQKLNSSIIHKMFGGTFLQTVVCQECKHESITHQDFFDIQVSIDNAELKYTNKATLKGSLRHYFEPNAIHKTKTEGYDCEKCKKKTNATTNVKIERAPEYLVVSVKRYEYTNNAIRGASQKIKHHLQIASQLELSQFAEDTDEPMRYQLLSFVSHEGRSASSGHYIAHCLQNNDSWAMYDDEYVQTVGNTGKMLKSKLDVYFMVFSRLQAIPKPQNGQVSSRRESDAYKTADEGYSDSEQESIPQPKKPVVSEQSFATSLKEKLEQTNHNKDNKANKKSFKSNGPLSLGIHPKNTLKTKSSSSSFNKLAKKMRHAKHGQGFESEQNGISSNKHHTHHGHHKHSHHSHDSSKKNSRDGPPLQKYGSQKKRKVSEIDSIFGRGR